MSERTGFKLKRRLLLAGDRVHIIGKHPWKGEVGELLRYESYGPRSLAMEGWRVSLNSGTECYAAPANLEKLP